MAKKQKLRFTYSHRTTVFTFTGRAINPLAAAVVSRTRQVFNVIMQDDGLWSITLQDVRIASGDSGQSPSRHSALAILEEHCGHLLQEE